MSADQSKALPITISGVSKTYGQVKALDNVGLDIASGEFLTVLGPSGSGKTTLLMVLAGFVRPDHGSVMFGSTEMVLTPPHKRNMGMVFQSYALFPHMNVYGNVAYPLKLRRASQAEISKRVAQALELVRLDGLEDRRVDQLSGGQRQRVALARSVVFRPRILLMDEPLSALDKKLREQMQIEIRHLHERLGMTTVYVTHDQREALTMSDRVAVMDYGSIVQVDRPLDLYERPRSRFVAGFVGESTFLEVSVANGEARLDGCPLKVARPLDSDAASQMLVIRPEKLALIGAAADPAMNLLEGHVKEVVYQGDSLLVYVTLVGGAEIAVRSPTRRETLASLPETGGYVRLGLHPEDTIVLP